MSKENFQYDGLMGLTFIDEDGNEMPAEDALHLQKSQSSDENISQDSRQQARTIWNSRQAPENKPEVD